MSTVRLHSTTVYASWALTIHFKQRSVVRSTNTFLKLLSRLTVASGCHIPNRERLLSDPKKEKTRWPPKHDVTTMNLPKRQRLAMISTGSDLWTPRSSVMDALHRSTIHIVYSNTEVSYTSAADGIAPVQACRLVQNITPHTAHVTLTFRLYIQRTTQWILSSRFFTWGYIVYRLTWAKN